MKADELWEKYQKSYVLNDDSIPLLIDRDKFLAALAEYGQAVREWRRVEDGLPERGISVLVYEPGRHIQKTAHDGYDWCLPHKSNVTHWMPLPEAPAAISREPLP